MPKGTRRSAILAAVGAIGALADLKPSSQLERLKVRSLVKAALGLPKEAIISRESGVIDIVTAKSMFTPAALQKAVEQAGAANGIQITVVGTPAVDGEVTKISFTNDLMKAQAQWGARGNSRQGRVLAAMPAPVATPNTNSVPPTSARKGGAKSQRKSTRKQTA